MQKGLIVEDLPQAAGELARRLLHVFPEITIQNADSLATARSVLNIWQPDITLLDLGLPDGEGQSLLDEGILGCGTIIVTTIFDDDQHLFSALRGGAHGYLLKDEPESVFIAALQGIIDGRPPLSPSIARRILGFFQKRAQSDTEPTSLSPREREVLAVIAKGYTVRQTAEILSLTTNTISGYLKSIYHKLQVNSRAEATREAIRLGLISPSSY